jgi:ubiquinone/menaquinone biosynthesis C-methylase UbiE
MKDVRNLPLDDPNKRRQSRTEHSSSPSRLEQLRASHAISSGISPCQMSDQQAGTNEASSSYNSGEHRRQARRYKSDSNNTRALWQRGVRSQKILNLLVERQKYCGNESKRSHEPVQEKIAGDPSGLDVHFAKNYLSMAEVSYYEAINPWTDESLKKTKAKLQQLANFLDKPQVVVSVGIGSGEEVQAAAKLFSGAQIYGLDISRQAIELAKDKLAFSGMEANWVEGSATKIPFRKESIDGFILSATLHEIYSYIPDGKQAWRQAIREVTTKLAENGALLLRDFAAPEVKDTVTMRMTSDLARQFYEYFREHHRVFASWGKEEVATLTEKRMSNDGDYPPVDKEIGVVQLPYARAAEVMLHFRNFHDNCSRDLTRLGDPHWKEINETYLPPHPSHKPAMAMPKHKYIEAVLAEGNKALADTPYTFICVQDALSERPETSRFLAEHFSLQLPGSEMISEQLVNGVTKKMELVFKKVKKSARERGCTAEVVRMPSCNSMTMYRIS